MKIIYTTDQVYLHGGIEKVLSQKANYFADIADYEVIIVTYNQGNKLSRYTFSPKVKLVDLGINYKEGISFFHPSNLLKVPKHVHKLSEILKTEKPDVLISSSFGPDFFFLPFVGVKIPKIKEFHTTGYISSNFSGMKNRLMNKLYHCLQKHYDRLVLLNEDEAKYYVDQKYVIIPNPAELDERTTTLDAHKIIAAGRISYQKNFEDLVEIWKIIHQRFPEWEIHIYGEDYLGRRQRIQDVINQHKFENNIKFMGITPDLKSTFLDYSVYVMTSVHETFPMVLLEALSVGLPIVSYNCPTGPDRIVTDGEDGFIVPYLDKENFAKKLSYIMEDVDFRKKLGINAKQNALRYDISCVMEKWQKLFNDLVSEKKI